MTVPDKLSTTNLVLLVVGVAVLGVDLGLFALLLAMEIKARKGENLMMTL